MLPAEVEEAGDERRSMSRAAINCVVLADRHHDLTEGMRDLLETTFDVVVMVANQASLFESAERLNPSVAVVDLSLVRGANLDWLQRLHDGCPSVKLLAISVHDEPCVRERALESGADGFVLKRNIATELLPAIDAMLAKRNKP